MIKQTDTESLINSRLFLTLWDIPGYISPRELMTLETNDKPSSIIVPCNLKDSIYLSFKNASVRAI